MALPSGPPSDSIFGMGFGADGNLYGLDSQTNPDAHLWKINTSTAAVTDLGGVGQTAIDATADPNGKMYGLTPDSNSVLYTLNPPSNTSSVVGPTGFMGTGLLAVNAAGTQIFAGAADTRSLVPPTSTVSTRRRASGRLSATRATSSSTACL